MLTPMMSLVQDQLGPDFGTKVAFVSITVDPERDTPEMLKLYAQMYGADLAGWSFLTGPPQRHSRPHAPLWRLRLKECERRHRPLVSHFDRRSDAASSASSISEYASTRRSFGAIS